MNPETQQTIDGLPILPAYVAGNDIHVWCQYCDCWHLHGNGGLAAELGTVLGHWCAHCYSASRSPYSETGYVLRAAGLWDELPADRKRGPRRRRRSTRTRTEGSRP